MKIDIEGNLFRTEAVRVEKSGDIFKMVFPLKLGDVIYIENYNRKTVVVSTKGEFIVSRTFSNLKKLFLENEDFISGHCSYLLNKSFFDRFEDGYVILSCNQKEFRLPVARRKLKDFKIECAKK